MAFGETVSSDPRKGEPYLEIADYERSGPAVFATPVAAPAGATGSKDGGLDWVTYRFSSGWLITTISFGIELPGSDDLVVRMYQSMR